MADKFTSYLHGKDDYDWIDARMDPEIVLKAARAAYPAFDPHAWSWTDLPNQGRQGACAGHALANYIRWHSSSSTALLRCSVVVEPTTPHRNSTE